MGGPKSSVGQVLRAESPRAEPTVLTRLTETQTWLLPDLCAEGSEKNNGLCQHFGQLPLQLSPWCRHFSSSLCVPVAPVPERRVSQSNKSGGPLRGTPGTPEAPGSFSHYPRWFLQPEVMETFLPGTGTLGCRVWFGAGTPHSSGEDCCIWDDPPNFYLTHVGVGPTSSVSPPLLSVSMQFPLYVLSCRTSVELDCRQIWVVVVLYFSCTSATVVGGHQYRVYLHRHLDQNSPPYFRM